MPCHPSIGSQAPSVIGLCQFLMLQWEGINLPAGLGARCVSLSRSLGPCVPAGAWSQCHQPSPTPWDSVSLQEPGPGATHSVALTSLGTLVVAKGILLGQAGATVPPPKGLNVRIPAGMMPPRLLARQDLGAAVPRPWPGWPRYHPRRQPTLAAGHPAGPA